MPSADRALLIFHCDFHDPHTDLYRDEAVALIAEFIGRHRSRPMDDHTGPETRKEAEMGQDERGLGDQRVDDLVGEDERVNAPDADVASRPRSDLDIPGGTVAGGPTGTEDFDEFGTVPGTAGGSAIPTSEGSDERSDRG